MIVVPVGHKRIAVPDAIIRNDSMNVQYPKGCGYQPTTVTYISLHPCAHRLEGWQW